VWSGCSDSVERELKDPSYKDPTSQDPSYQDPTSQNPTYKALARPVISSF